MSTAIDAAVVLFVAFAAWRGFRNGFFRGLFGLLAVIAAIYGANLAAKSFSDELTGLLRPFVGGAVDTAVSGVIRPQEGDEGDKGGQDVFDVSMDALEKIGVSKAASSMIAEEVASEVGAFGRQVSGSIADKLSAALAYVAVFGIAFVLISIAFAILGSVLGLALSLPGIETVDRVLGMVFGVVKGVLVVLVLALVIRYVGILPAEMVERTVVLKYIINGNPLAPVLGI